MVTKAIVYGREESDDGIVRYYVWVPLLWGTQSSRPKLGETDARLLTASVCDAQGSLSNYAEGDVVYVAFEDQVFSRPVILGSLSARSSAKRGSSLLSLDVESSAALPEETTIGGVTSSDLQALLQLGQVSSLPRLLMQIIQNLNQLSASENQISVPQSWTSFLNEGEAT